MLRSLLLLAALAPLGSSVSEMNAFGNQMFPHRGSQDLLRPTNMEQRLPRTFLTSRRLLSPFACRMAQQAPELMREEQNAFTCSALDRLISAAQTTIDVSWKQMEDVNDGDSSRSASGGTTWADGGWVDKELQTKLIDTLNQTIAAPGAWEWLKAAPEPFFVEFLSTDQVDVTVHFIPRGMTLLPWRRPTGSKVFAKTLFGECDVIQMLGDPHGRRPMRQATRLKIEEDGVLLYLGGPPRVYGEATLDEPCAVLEVALHSKQPMMGLGRSMKGYLPDAIGYEEEREVARLRLREEQGAALLWGREELAAAKREAVLRAERGEAAAAEDGALGFEAQDLDLAALRENIGGLDEAISALIRRAFLTRQLPAGTMEELGLRHVKGVLLHGPPGCGKTLTARLMAASLGASKSKVVSGPELLDKWVGEAERNVRALFWEAEREWKERGERSALHVIILDEIDSLARERGSLRGDSSGVRDSVVNQLLAIVDGVRELDNVLLIGLSNRKDLIEPALLRPGRLEVHLEIKEPDARGRVEILRIHMRKLREAGRLGPGAWEWAESEGAGERMAGMSGAFLAGIVRGASANAIQRALDSGVDGSAAAGAEHLMVLVEDLERALAESLATAKARPSWKKRVLRLPRKLLPGFPRTI